MLKRLFVIFDPVFALLGLVGYAGVPARRVMASSKKVLPLTRWVFRNLGYLAIRDHYYEHLTFDATGSNNIMKLLTKIN